MSWGSAFWWPHKVTVRDLLSTGGLSDTYGAPRVLAAEVLDEQRLVRGRDGAEVVSSTQVTVPLDAGVPLGSRVTVWAGTPRRREAEVLAVASDDNTGSPLGSHLVLSLT